MRLVTANLYNGRADPESLRLFLDAVRPDLLVGQEVGFDAADIIRARLPYGLVLGADDHTGTALASRTEIDVERLDVPFRGAVRTATRVGGEPVEVVGVHLANPIDGWGRVADRKRQLDALEPVLDRPGRRLLAGDLNATPIWPVYRRLSRWMVDGVARHAAEMGRRPRRTWSPRPGGLPLLRIDHVFVRGLIVTGVRMGRIAGCDHRPLVVDLAPAP